MKICGNELRPRSTAGLDERAKRSATLGKEDKKGLVVVGVQVMTHLIGTNRKGISCINFCATCVL